MKPEKILVLGGGSSAEREVSLRSAAAVAKALRSAGYSVTEADPADLSEAELIEIAQSCDVTFLIVHGAGGEDGTLQRIFEQHRIPFVGADATISDLCFDKPKLKEKYASLDINMPAGMMVSNSTIGQSPLAAKPFVLKPYEGGSSIDTFIVHDPARADQEAIEAALDKYSEMLLEELIPGTEITVAVVLDEVFPVIEIIPPVGAEFDYENKYNGKTAELCPPQHISEEVQKAAQELALRLHKELGINDLSRTDMIVRDSDESLVVLETNTLPGMTDQSLVPKAAAVAGYDMPTLCSRLVEAAYQRAQA